MTFKGRRAKACLCSSLTLLCLSLLLAFPLAAAAKKAPREAGARASSTGSSKADARLVASRSSSSTPTRQAAIARSAGQVDPVQALFEALRSGDSITVAQATQLLSSGQVTGDDLKAMLALKVVDSGLIARAVTSGRVSEAVAIEALGKGFTADGNRRTGLDRMSREGGPQGAGAGVSVPVGTPKSLDRATASLGGRMAEIAKRPGSFDPETRAAERFYSLLVKGRFSMSTPAGLLGNDVVTEATLDRVLMPTADKGATFGLLLRTRQVRPPTSGVVVQTMSTQAAIENPDVLYRQIRGGEYTDMSPARLVLHGVATAEAVQALLAPGADQSATIGALMRERLIQQAGSQSRSAGTVGGIGGIGGPVALGGNPACPGAGDCCAANGTPGCNDATCCNVVCDIDPFCCNNQWDGLCANTANANCAVCAGSSCPASTNDCCSPGTGPGCSDTACCDAVCALDPFCCNNTWDGLCANAADSICAICAGGSDCPAGATNDCCSTGGPGCSDTACCDAVCAVDSFCCDVSWDGLCVAQAITICGCVPPPDPACNGSAPNGCCEQGGPGCSDTACCNAVCAVDAFCCDVAWDSLCVGQAEVICGCVPPDPCGGASNDCCSTGGPGCSDAACCNAVCAVDSFCCDVAWDGLCVAQAITICGCTPPPNPACNGSAPNGCCEQGGPGCSDTACCNAVCAVDPFCCDVAWDSLCVGQAEVICGCVPPDPCGGASNDCCSTGGPGCSDAACCNAVCAVDAFCCDIAWDTLCVAQAITICGCVPPPNPACASSTNNCCTASPNGTPGCNDPACCNTVCALDPFCCDIAWDGLCAIGAAINCAACQVTCPPCPAGATQENEPNCGLPSDNTNGGCNTPVAPGDCGVPHPGVGCSDQACEDTVCAVDPFCCDVAWDGLCAAQANALCTPTGVPLFTNVECGQTICGTYAFDPAIGIRDTDWYELVLGPNEAVLATWCVTGQAINTLSGFVEGSGSGNCSDITGFVNPFVFAPQCQPGCTSVALEGPGEFWFFVASDFIPTTCPTPYTATLTCVVLGACCQQATLDCDLMGEAECVAIGGEFLGDGTSCGDCFGACCQPDNSCAVTTESFCTGDWLGAGTGCEVANTYSSNPNQPIPDAPGGPISNTINVPDSFDVSDVNVVLDISHTWVGDLTVCLSHGPFTVRLIDRPGLAGVTNCPGNNLGCCGCDANNYDGIVIDDEGTGGPIETQCVNGLSSPPNYTPAQAFGLGSFDGLDAQGAWTLTVQDNAGADVGVLHSWSIQIGTGQNACNDPPTCDAGGPYTSECAPIAMTVSADDDDGDVVTYSWSSNNPAVIVTPPAGATGPGGGPITATASLAPGVAPCDVTAVLTLNLSDGGGGVGSCTTTVTFDDNVAPSISCPANTTIECDESTGPANTGSATATDNCDADVTVSFTDTETPGACADERTITRVWTATDDCGNSSSCTQTIEVQDNTPPTIVCPATTTVQCGALTDPSVTGAATATDNCDPEPDLSYTQTDEEGTCPVIRVITRTWTATDRCGNEASCVQVINVVDTTPPVFTQQPTFGGGASNCAFLWPADHEYVVFDISDTGVAATDNCGCATFLFSSCCSSQPEDANGMGDGSTLDDCIISVDGTKVAMRAERNGACSPLDRQYTVTIVATDECGNTANSDAAQVCVYHDMGHKPPPTGPIFSSTNYPGNGFPPGQWVDSGCYGSDGSACGNGCTANCDPTQF